MAYRGEPRPLEPNSNRPLPSRPPPERWENLQTTEAKQNKRKGMNAPSIKKTSFAIPTVLERNVNRADFQLTTYENLPPIMDPISPFINSYPLNNSVLLSTPLSSINQPYVNLPLVIYSNSTNYSYSYSITFLLHLYILYFLHLIRLQVKLFIFSFKPRHIHHPIIYS